MSKNELEPIMAVHIVEELDFWDFDGEIQFTAYHIDGAYTLDFKQATLVIDELEATTKRMRAFMDSRN